MSTLDIESQRDLRSKVERIKENSRNLRGTLAEDLQQDEPFFTSDNIQLLKFHGLYQQDDRDVRKMKGREKEYSFMIRSRISGGGLSAKQYLAHDDLASKYGNNTLRLTTRQTFQLHGIIKGDIKKTIRELHEALIISIGACGDIVRNVMCCPAPGRGKIDHQIREFGNKISDELLPNSRAYHEIWLDGEKILSTAETEDEPIYGTNYLPRKFKIGIAWPGDNCVDVYTQDIGLIAVLDNNDNLLGFNLLVGGGMGMHHKNKDTFPRLADVVAYVTKEETLHIVKEVVKIQRDFGNRENRKNARFKYLLHDWGVEKFRQVLEERLGYTLENAHPIAPLVNDLHLGWHQQDDGKWYLGISVQNGRIADFEVVKLRTGLRTIIEKFNPNIRLSANQDILLTDIQESDIPGIEALLATYRIPHENTLSNARKYSMACPAMPTCGLAIAESERVFPDVINDFEQLFTELGLSDEVISIRMTGCPNGCARPYVADIGFVGRGLDKYTVFIGGDPAGTRLNRVYKDLVALDNLVESVKPLLLDYKEHRLIDEKFSDYLVRTLAFEEE